MGALQKREDDTAGAVELGIYKRREFSASKGTMEKEHLDDGERDEWGQQSATVEPQLTPMWTDSRENKSYSKLLLFFVLFDNGAM